MQISTSEADGITTVTLTGSLDIRGSAEVELPFSRLSGQGTPLVIDASGVDYISSIGIRTLLTAARAINMRGGRMAVVAATEEVTKVLKTTGVDAIIPLFADMDEAINAARVPVKE